MKAIYILFTLAFSGFAAAKEFHNDFIKLGSGQQLYVEHYQALDGQPTVFLLNGLTYSTENWKPLVAELRKLNPGLGIVLYDMVGMGRTLIENYQTRKDDIPMANQVRDLHELKKLMNIKGKTAVIGESYGSAVALLNSTIHPDDFDIVVAMAPFLERLPDQDRYIQTQLTWHNLMFPADPRNQEEIYDYYLRQLVYSTYPAAEPTILSNPYKLEAVFRMVKGAKNWNAMENAHRLPANRVHVLAAVDDEHVKVDRINLFWNSIPTNVRESFLLMQKTHHKIPEERPTPTAAWLTEILNGGEHMRRGLTFSYDPALGTARSGEIVIPLEPKKVGSCETLLGKLPEPRK